MTPAQRAVLAKAKKDGLKPSEQASEFLLHDLVEACLSQLKNYSVAWKNLSEKEQDASIHSLTDSLKESVTDAVRLIMAAGASAIPFKLKSLTIDGKLKVTGLVEGDHPERHALTDKAHDKSEILLILSPRDYFEGVDTIHGEKDQKSLPIDEPAGDTGKKPAAKGKVKSVADVAASIALDPAMMEKASKFIADVKTPTIAGIQNVLGIGFQKAEAVLAELARNGEILEEADGTYRMPPVTTDKPLTKKQQAAADKEAKEPVARTIRHIGGEVITTTDGSDPFEGLDDPQDWVEDGIGSGLLDSLTDDIYEAIKAGVIEKQSVAKIAITIKHGVTDEVADQAIDRLEMDGVISEMDELGGREVYEQPA